MLLAIDIGNTHTVVGCFDDRELRCHFRLHSDKRRTIDEYRVMLVSMLREEFGPTLRVTASIISSVVPPLTPLFMEAVERAFSVTPLVVGAGIKTSLDIRTMEPSSVGADRIVNAVAVRELYGAPALVVDFGTATTFDYVGADGAYEGGIIVPGVGVSVDALVSRTSKLPQIELVWPKSVIGKSTVQAMQSGAVIGYISMVDGLIDRVLREAGPIPHLVATGGFGKLCTDYSERIKSYDPQLTLKGMLILADLNLGTGGGAADGKRT